MTKKLRLTFMGTPEIAERLLSYLLEEQQERVEVVGVFTQPDKPVGRKMILTSPPVKVRAMEAGIPVFQPRRIKRERWLKTLRELEADLALVVAYGQILSADLVDAPRLGCYNIHTSLLPAYRGAAPIQWALANGEKTSGVTLMKMDEGMDTGPIVLQKEVAIAEREELESFYEKLIEVSKELVDRFLEGLSQGESFPETPQDGAKASMAPMLRKEDGRVDWRMSASQLDCRLRAFSAWPGTYTTYDQKLFRILEARALEQGEAPNTSVRSAGAWFEEAAEKKHPRLLVQCGEGVLELFKVQPEGKKPMAAADFLRGILSQAKPRRFTNDNE